MAQHFPAALAALALPQLRLNQPVELDQLSFGCGFIMALDDGLVVILMTNRNYGVWDHQNQVMAWLLEAEE